jgi:cytoskeletal protein RodZ
MFYRFFQNESEEPSTKKKDKLARAMSQQAMELDDLSTLASTTSESSEPSPTSADPSPLYTSEASGPAATASWSENDDPVVSKLSFGSDDSLDDLPNREKAAKSGWGFRLRLPFSGSSSPSN